MCKYNIIFIDYAFTSYVTKKDKQYIKNHPKFDDTRKNILNTIGERYNSVNISDYAGTVHYIPKLENKNIYDSADILMYIRRSKKINDTALKSAFKILNSYFNKCIKNKFIDKNYYESDNFLIDSFGKEQLNYLSNHGINIREYLYAY